VRKEKAKGWAHLCAKIAARSTANSTAWRCDWHEFKRTIGLPQSRQPTALKDQKDASPARFLSPAESLQRFAEEYASVFRTTREWTASAAKKAAAQTVLDRDVLLKSLPQIVPPVSTEEAARIIHSLPSNRAPGNDGVSNALLKCLPKTAQMHIANLFTLSLNTGLIPTQWKTTKCIALHKGGDATVWSNFRLIALSATLLKALETVVLRRLQHNTGPHAHHRTQFGFRAGHSTADAIQYVHSRISADVKRLGATFVAFLDLTKAFDKVDVDILLKTLAERQCLPQGTWRWVHAYLKGRSFTVHANTLRSSPAPATNGTPQGGVLSPELFLYFIDGLARAVDAADCDIVLFADDVAIIPCAHDIGSAAKALQRGLNAADAWARENMMVFNPSKGKSAVMVFSQHRLQTNTLPRFRLGDAELEYVPEYKYLGVIFDNALTFAAHKVRAINKTKAALALIARTIVPAADLPPQLIRQLIIQYALPSLLYGAHVIHYTRSELQKTRGQLSHTLAKALKLPPNTHHDSMLFEFRIAPPFNAIAEATIRYAAKLQKSSNAAGAQWRQRNPSHPHGQDHTQLLTVTTNYTRALRAGNGDGTAFGALARDWRDGKWGASLKQALATLHPNGTPLHAPQYLYLPQSQAAPIAALRFDNFSFWRRFKSKTRDTAACGLCGAQSGDAMHIALHCSGTARARGTLSPEDILNPSKTGTLQAAKQYTAYLYSAVKGT
jgi:hypothetical protein